MSTTQEKSFEEMSDRDLLSSYRKYFTEGQDQHPGFPSCHSCDPLLTGLNDLIETRGERMTKKAQQIRGEIYQEVGI